MTAALLEHIKSLATDTTASPTCVYSLAECPVERHTIECTKCSSILHQRLLLSCGKLVCSSCLVAGVRETKGKDASYHHCNMPLQPSHVLTPPDAIRDIISSLPVVCGNCAKPVKREHMKRHKSSRCKCYIYTPPTTMLAAQSPDTPVNKSELQVAGSILNCYGQQAHSSGIPNDILQIPKGSQGGKVYTCMYKYTCIYTCRLAWV